MLKQVPVDELHLGMYVASLDRPWTGTRFMFQGFEISTPEALEELRRVCQYVTIDTEPEREKNPAHSPTPVPLLKSGPPGVVERASQARDQQSVLQNPAASQHWHPDVTTLEEELSIAREVEGRARTAVFTILDDVAFGRSVDTASAREIVAELAESVIRNPDAVVVLSQLKHVDEYTAMHCLRVSLLALVFGRHLGLSRPELNILGLGALLHDVGKMRVPLEILNKPGRLTEAEFEIMKSHVPHGLAVLEQSAGLPPAALEIVGRHHERYSGGGYMTGMNGDAIGLFGMMASIVDCYDAVTSDRVYRLGIPAHEALTRMYEWRVKDFHPALVEQFIQCMGIYPIGSIVELENGAIGVVTTVNRERRLRPRIALVLNPDKKRYKRVKIVDLKELGDQHPGTAVEIRAVLPDGSHGIRASDYLPIKNNLPSGS